MDKAHDRTMELQNVQWRIANIIDHYVTEKNQHDLVQILKAAFTDLNDAKSVIMDMAETVGSVKSYHFGIGMPDVALSTKAIRPVSLDEGKQPDLATQLAELESIRANIKRIATEHQSIPEHSQLLQWLDSSLANLDKAAAHIADLQNAKR